MSVDAVTAAWLKSPYSSVAIQDGALVAAWGAIATNSEIVSALADRAAAVAEGGRQMGFLGFAIGAEKIRVPGLRLDLLGKLIDATCDRGTMTVERCLVIGVDELAGIEMTILTVLRKLA